VPARSKEAGEARELIRDIPELTFIDVKLVDRKVWRDATAKGLSIIEYSPANQKAVDELWALYEALFDLRFDTKKKSKRRGK
jgi:cellulose biosynthesis protein BcsQ